MEEYVILDMNEGRYFGSPLLAVKALENTEGGQHNLYRVELIASACNGDITPEGNIPVEDLIGN